MTFVRTGTNTTRVQIPAYTDAWMRGDRYGEIVKISRPTARSIGVRARLLTSNPHERSIEVAHVKLDKSGRTVRVILADCAVL